MLKISVTPDGNDDRLETTIESSGPLDDVVAELGLAVLRMQEGLQKADALAGYHFKAAVTAMFSDPEFWSHKVNGTKITEEAQITTYPRFK